MTDETKPQCNQKPLNTNHVSIGKDGSLTVCVGSKSWPIERFVYVEEEQDND